MGEVTLDEVHSLFHTSGSSSSHFCLDTAGSAQDTGLLASEGFPAWKLQWAWMRLFHNGWHKWCWLLSCPSPLTLSSVLCAKIRGAKHILHSKTKLLRKAGSWLSYCYYYGNMSRAENLLPWYCKNNLAITCYGEADWLYYTGYVRVRLQHRDLALCTATCFQKRCNFLKKLWARAFR